jgi:hypothetical protein
MVVVITLIAVPLLYVLSVPPVYLGSQRFGFSMRLVNMYCEPSQWIFEHVPVLKPAMTAYYQWWQQQYLKAP